MRRVLLHHVPAVVLVALHTFSAYFPTKLTLKFAPSSFTHTRMDSTPGLQLGLFIYSALVTKCSLSAQFNWLQRSAFRAGGKHKSNSAWAFLSFLLAVLPCQSPRTRRNWNIIQIGFLALLCSPFHCHFRDQLSFFRYASQRTTVVAVFCVTLLRADTVSSLLLRHPVESLPYNFYSSSLLIFIIIPELLLSVQCSPHSSVSFLCCHPSRRV